MAHMADHVNLMDIEGDHVVALDASERAKAASSLDAVTQDPYQDLDEFLLEATLAFHELPKRVKRVIVRFKREGNVEGCLLVRGLPVDPDLPDTPPDSDRSPSKVTFRSEIALGAVAGALGEAIGYLQEKRGEIFQNVCPTPLNEREWSSESSKAFLPFHTETAFHPFMPSYVLLYCLRADTENGARTLIASVRHLYPSLNAQEQELLWEPVFETGIDYSFGSDTGKRGGGPVTPVCYGAREDPYFRFDPGLMRSDSPAAEELLAKLEQMAEKSARYVTLVPGDLLILDNRRAIHARTTFSARYDGRDRWLQRVFVVDSLTDSADDRAYLSRVITTTFEF